MTTRTSNSKFLAILDPLPRTNIGWWVEVYDAHQTNTMLARILRFEQLAFLDSRSDVGVGSVVFANNDPFLTEPLPNGAPAASLFGEPSYWRIYDNGVERFRFLYEGQKRPRDEKSPIRAISGKGRATELAFGTVLSANFPTQTKAVVRKYVNRSWAYVWLELLAEAQLRGSVPDDIVPTFDADTDSKGEPWGDLADYEVPVGGDLLALLNQYAEAAGFDWHMSPSGYLDAARSLGFNRTGSVRFFEGINVVTAEDATDLSELRNDIYSQAADGTIVRAFSLPSIFKHRRREAFITASAGDVTTTSIAANGTLRILKDPITSRTLQVPLEVLTDSGASTGRRAFVDYAVGDLIGYGPRDTLGENDVRVVSMGVKVTADGAELEVTVQSRRERLIEKMRRILARQLAGSFSPSSSTSTITSVIKQVVTGSVALSELTDVNADGVTDGQTLIYDVDTGEWIPASVGAVPLDDLTDVNVTGATDGQALVKSGSGWVARDVLNSAKLAGETSSDEFDTTSLDAAWVRVDKSGGAGRASWAQGRNVLSGYNAGGDSAQELHALMRPLTGVGGALATGDAFVTAFRLYAYTTNQYVMGGIVLADGVTPTAGTQVVGLCYILSATAAGGSLRRYTGYLTQAADAGGTASPPMGGRWWQRVVYLGGTSWRMDLSPDGVHWLTGTANLTATVTPTHVGLVTSSFGTATRGITTYDLLRRVSGVT